MSNSIQEISENRNEHAIWSIYGDGLGNKRIAICLLKRPVIIWMHKGHIAWFKPAEKNELSLGHLCYIDQPNFKETTICLEIEMNKEEAQTVCSALFEIHRKDGLIPFF